MVSINKSDVVCVVVVVAACTQSLVMSSGGHQDQEYKTSASIEENLLPEYLYDATPFVYKEMNHEN